MTGKSPQGSSGRNNHGGRPAASGAKKQRHRKTGGPHSSGNTAGARADFQGKPKVKHKTSAPKPSVNAPRSKGASRGSLVELPAIQPRNAKGYPKKMAAGKGAGGVGGAAGAGTGGYKRHKKPISANRQKGFHDGKRPYDYAVYEREPATPEYLARLFAQYGYDVCGRELEAYWLYYDLLRTMNAELDLTRIMGIEATVLKHFIDSSIIADMTEIRGPLLDIGSGPGFPGAPIAIRKPDLQVILAESRGKRVRFLEMVKEKLKLKNVTIFPRSVREDSDIRAMSVISRALESIPGTLQRVKTFLPAGGRVLFLKGPNCGQEITQAQEMFKGIYKMVEDVRYDLPASDQSRRLIVFERREES